MSKFTGDTKFYSIGACDPAGSPWTVRGCEKLTARDAVAKYNELFEANKARRGNQVFFITDDDDPERGDMIMALEEAIDEEDNDPNCEACVTFFARFRCNIPDECDCPKCQGYCGCDREEVICG
jgi:hypothetical protein